MHCEEFMKIDFLLSWCADSLYEWMIQKCSKGWIEFLLIMVWCMWIVTAAICKDSVGIPFPLIGYCYEWSRPNFIEHDISFLIKKQDYKISCCCILLVIGIHLLFAYPENLVEIWLVILFLSKEDYLLLFYYKRHVKKHENRFPVCIIQ